MAGTKFKKIVPWTSSLKLKNSLVLGSDSGRPHLTCCLLSLPQFLLGEKCWDVRRAWIPIVWWILDTLLSCTLSFWCVNPERARSLVNWNMGSSRHQAFKSLTKGLTLDVSHEGGVCLCQWTSSMKENHFFVSQEGSYMFSHGDSVIWKKSSH